MVHALCHSFGLKEIIFETILRTEVLLLKLGQETCISISFLFFSLLKFDSVLDIGHSSFTSLIDSIHRFSQVLPILI